MKAYMAGVLLLACMQAAHADTIKPTCWEENVNGEVRRHCAVNRPNNKPALHNEAPAAVQAPPPVAPPPPPQAYGPPPRQPFNGRWVGPQSMPRDFGPGGNGAPYYAPPPYYGPPPVAMFGFGPFTVVIP
jgi:hypothetical protein